MVKKSNKKAQPKGNLIPPESYTGYPKRKPAKTPEELLSRTAGGGRRSAS